MRQRERDRERKREEEVRSVRKMHTRRGCLVLDLVLPYFATHFCQACLRLVVHQNESHKLASLRESCHIFCVYVMWGLSVA